MHKSQGFGVEIDRGERKEYFKFLDGKPDSGDGIFDGIDTTWSRVPNASGVSEKIRQILQKYQATEPSASIPALLDLRKMLRDLGENDWATEKLADLDEIIGACLGLHLDAVTEKPAAQPGENLPLQIEAINRSPVEVKLESLRVLKTGKTIPIGKMLAPNELLTEKTTVALPRGSALLGALLAAPAGHDRHLCRLRSNPDRSPGKSTGISARCDAANRG